MADRKNQHFVPRAHLKPWSMDCEGKAINLYNIRGDRDIRLASVKKQCSRNYFYGKSLEVENWLGHGEGLYSRYLNEVRGLTGQPLLKALGFLRDFAYLQYSRTERSVEEDMAFTQRLYDEVAAGTDEEPPSREHAVSEAIQRWDQTRHQLADLKPLLILNQSEVPLVTSDDPAVLTNKLSVVRHGSDTVGLSVSGALFLMPLAPDLAVLFYDGAVYTVPDKSGARLIISKASDVLALNELQYLKANQNIYFAQWGQLESVRTGFLAVADRRISTQHRFTKMIPVEGEPNTFRRASEEEAAAAQRFFLATERISFVPARWPSKVKFRSDGHGYSDGSALGYVRWSEAQRRGLTRKHKTKVRAAPFERGTTPTLASPRAAPSLSAPAKGGEGR